MATTSIRESTITRAADYLNHIRQLVVKNPTMPVSDMKKEATKMHIGTTYIDQAIALGYFKRDNKGVWKIGLGENADFSTSQAKAMVEKSNEYNRVLMRARAKRAAEAKARKPAPTIRRPARRAAAAGAVASKTITARPARTRKATEAHITGKYSERYLTDKVILEQFMKKHLITNLDLWVLTSELHRRGLVGTLSGSIQV